MSLSPSGCQPRRRTSKKPYAWSGRGRVLPPFLPLRTGRASFPASGSSLANARCRTRFPHHEPQAVGLAVAGGMQQDPIGEMVPAAQRPPDEVMVVPSRLSGNRFLADRTATALLFPQEVERPSPLQVVLHLHAEAFFEVDFPR